MIKKNYIQKNHFTHKSNQKYNLKNSKNILNQSDFLATYNDKI